MPKTTFNNEQSIDFIKSIAALAEPFNSTMFEQYADYTNADSDQKTTFFLGALNLIGQTGCKFLYDKVINYIDDVSNIDTCFLDALLSTATTLQTPYKNKVSVDFLTSISSAHDVLQLIVWLMSCNTRNTKHLLSRLEIADDEKLKHLKTKKEIFEDPDISSVFKQLLKGIFVKTHTYPTVTEEKMLINFFWNFLPLFENTIYSHKDIYKLFIQPIEKSSVIHKLDFGKYNFTIHEHTCIKLLQLEDTGIEDVTNELLKRKFPFLFNNTFFDYIEAAVDILFNGGDINKYTSVQQLSINTAIQAINTTGQFVLDSYSLNLNELSQLNRLNSYTFADEFLLNTLANDISNILNIDITDYFYINVNSIKKFEEEDVIAWWDETFKPTINKYSQFGNIKIVTSNANVDELFFNVNNYVSDIYNAISKNAFRLTTLREDIKLLTMRNAFKGTNAIVQLATAEYLNDNLPHIVDNVIDELIPESHRLKLKNDQDLIEVLNEIYNEAILDPSDVEIIEYWDTTEYYGRTKDDLTDMYPADWNMSPWAIYGDTSKIIDLGNTRNSDDIVRFYANTLGLSKNILKKRNNFDADLSTEEDMAYTTTQLMFFLRSVYNAGIYNKALPDNIQKIFSGNPTNNILRQFYTNYKSYSVVSSNIIDRGIDRISKQVHPYIWNFTSDSTGLAASIIGGTTYTTSSGSASGASGIVSTLQQDLEVKLLNSLIGASGNILNQWRLNLKYFADESNYWTRYESFDHNSDLSVVCYDGYVYPPFAKELLNSGIELSAITNIDILSYLLNDGLTIYQKWYRKAGGRTLRPDEISKENKVLQQEFNYIIDSIDSNTGVRKIMQNYTVDINGTAYSVDTRNNAAVIYYKDATYPFMRPLRQLNADNQQLGMTFIDEAHEEITEFANIYFEHGYENTFPNVVASENGKYLLIRLSETKLGLFMPTFFVNNGYVDKALMLLYIIDFEEFLNSIDKTLNTLSLKITEGGVKTLGNNFAILLTNTTENKFENYLLTIGPSIYKFVKINIDCDSEDRAGKMTAGLTLTNDTQNNIDIILSIFGIATDITSFTTIHNLGHENSENVLETPIGNTETSSTSFDVFNQFVHMLVLSNVSTISNTLNTRNLVKTQERIIAKSDTVNKIWIIGIPEEHNISVHNYSFNDGGFKNNTDTNFYLENFIPFARRYNLNSDAGFNPCYLGKHGKLVLPDKKRQYSLSTTKGAAITLLGPSIDYDGIDSELSDEENKSYAVRIHEQTHTNVLHDPAIININTTDTNNLNISQDFTTYFKYDESIYKINGNIKTPRIFSCQLTKLSDESNKFTENTSLDLDDTANENFVSYLFNSDDMVATDANYNTVTHIGNAYLLFKTGESNIWIPTALKNNKMVNAGFNKSLFDIVFANSKTEISQTYKILQVDGTLTEPYTFDSIHIKRTGNKISIALAGNLIELINIEVIIIGVLQEKINGELPNVPAFMLLGNEFISAVIENGQNFTDFHIRVPHSEQVLSYNNAYNINRDNQGNPIYNSTLFDITDGVFKNGSAVFSMEEKDSVLLTSLLPNQYDTILDTGKPLLGEVLNEMFRIKNYNLLENNMTTASAVSNMQKIYDFKYFQFRHLNLVEDDTQPILSDFYLVQLEKDGVNNQSLDFLKNITYSAWRRAESITVTNEPQHNVENTLPKNVKITEDFKPVEFYSKDISITDTLNLMPRLAIRWKYVNENIELRFDNAFMADSIFFNENNNLTYISLATTPASLELQPANKPALFNIVSPIHIIAGNTVFTDIPLNTLLLTNVSDDKPKFMLTMTPNLSDAKNSDAYALVFNALNVPEIENKNQAIVHCYVAKLNNINQKVIPQIDDSIKLSQLLFNMNIANILNTNLEDTINARDDFATVKIDSIYGKTHSHIIKTLREASAIRHDNHSTIKVAIKSVNAEENMPTPYFSIIDMSINFNNVTEYTLKNALINADRDQVIAIDTDGNKVFIAKVFGCSFNKIGVKKVMSTFRGSSANLINLKIDQRNWLIPYELEEPAIPVAAYLDGVEPKAGAADHLANVLIAKQGELNRETAILVNAEEADVNNALMRSKLPQMRE